MTKLFHFNCYALVALHEDYDGGKSLGVTEDSYFENFGLFLSRENAEVFRDKYEEARVEAIREGHEQSCWRIYECTIPAVHYYIIPLEGLRIKDGGELYSVLKQAAKLQAVGVGRVA